MKNPTIAITMGDPCGIGPEVTLKALRVLNKDRRHGANLRVYGDRKALDAVVRLCLPRSGVSTRVSLVDLGVFRGAPCAGPCIEGGRAGLVYLDAAIADAMSGQVGAIVTAPLSKEAVRMTRRGFVGHTEHLGGAFNVEKPVMMMVGGGLRVALVTTHCALKDVPRLASTEMILHTIHALYKSLRRYFDVARPRLAVCGLNPHPAENAQWTREDRYTVTPAVRQANKSGIDCTGPLAGDTAFYRALGGEFDAVVAMYHDQGLAPLKTIAFKTAVNVTLGLPIIRTSPGHGTAFDIAGRGVADPRAMVEAVRCAVEMLEADRTRK